MKKIEITIGQILKIFMWIIIISPSLYTAYLIIFNCEYATYLAEDASLSLIEHCKSFILLIGMLEFFILSLCIIGAIIKTIEIIYDKVKYIKIFTLSSKPESKPNHKAVEDIQSEFGITIH